MYQLNEPLLQKVLSLTSKVDLTVNDNPTAQAYRGHYAEAKAKGPPRVIQCDTMAGDTWFHGIKLGERATAWTELWTGGNGTYCTTQQEDNATYMALTRGANSGLVDLNRVAVLRTASNFGPCRWRYPPVGWCNRSLCRPSTARSMLWLARPV